MALEKFTANYVGTLGKITFNRKGGSDAESVIQDRSGMVRLHPEMQDERDER